jgi:phosphate transport system substrate-binding protein
MKKTLKFGALAAIVAAALTGCGSGSSSADNSSTAGTTSSGASTSTSGNLSGTVTIDGSSTVFPIANAMGEDFNKANSGVKVTVNKSGTGSGMQKFARGEIDIAAASRPITQKEMDDLKAKGIDFIEVPIAYDGVCVVVNPKNSFVQSMTPDDLYKAWNQDSKVSTWADWHAGWPAKKINFYGPTSNHGTYEYFTEAIDKKKGNIRKDYQSNQEYNVVVQELATDENGIGYMGMDYYSQNKDKVKVISIDAGKGPVAPSEKTIVDGTYTPLSRPLFIYVSKKAFARPEVKAFVDFTLSKDGVSDVKEANYVGLPDDAIAKILQRTDAGTTGSIFSDVKPGTPMSEVLSKVSTAK